MTRFARLRSWLPLLPLLGLLAVTYWLNEQVQTEAAKPDKSKQHFPDAIMENFSGSTLDLQGQPRGGMAGKVLRHYPDDDTTEVELPKITSLASNRPPVYITAQHALISSKGDEVFLDHRVKVLRVADAQRVAMTLDTEYLHAIPDKDWCDTDKAVRVVQGQSVLTAIGMEMDNQAQILKLRAQVKSDYVQAKK
jgi:lipopolysaccharide export system protein LptC